MTLVARAAAAILLLALAIPGTAVAQDKNLVGVWTVVSVTYGEGAEKTEPYGANVKGTQIFDASGRFAVVVTRADLPKVASNNREQATVEESEKIVRGSLGYFGTYTTNEADKSFTVQIEGSTFPNFVGTSQTRNYAISGDELRITNPTASGGRAATVVLKRASQKPM
jgi:lipocalin-like protein